MRFERTAERAARAVYGTIIALAVIAALEGGEPAAGEVAAAVIGGVIAAQLAELYAQYLAAVIRRQRHPEIREMGTALGDSAAGTLAALVTVVPFVLGAAGAMELDTAFDVAFWAGLGLLAAYTLLANRLAGLSGLRNAVACVAVLTIGLALIALKSIVH
ncbi:MAG: hypothetical protein ACRDLO_06035 [Solirubrobacterales bacterium]